MTSGVFTARPGPWRSRALDSRPTSACAPAVMQLPADPTPAARRLIQVTRRMGYAVGLLQERLTVDDFLHLGAVIGTPTRETSPDVARFVDAECVLNLVATEAAGADPSLQPFSPDPLTLHSESSGAPASCQPRYICLMCVDPGDPHVARTLLVRMADVYRGLADRVRHILERTSYARGHPPAILRLEEGRPTFAFRDFQSAPLAWTSTSGAAVEEVNAALDHLLAAMYSQPRVAITWQAGLVVLIDNQQMFHGRTRGAPSPVGGPVRHLRRLRLLERR